MEGNRNNDRDELLEACHDLRLPVAGNERVETLELYIQAAYDDFEEKSNSMHFHEELQSDSQVRDTEIDYGSIGDKSWRIKYLLNKILFFL
jgi:hypothetical protein